MSHGFSSKKPAAAMVRRHDHRRGVIGLIGLAILEVRNP